MKESTGRGDGRAWPGDRRWVEMSKAGVPGGVKI